MKAKFIYVLLGLFFIASYTKAASEPITHPHRHKKVVIIKPASPHVRVYKPHKIKNGHVWIEGHWQWNKRTHTYVWIKGHLIIRKIGKIWIKGYWKPVKGGWIYKPGKWA